MIISKNRILRLSLSILVLLLSNTATTAAAAAFLVVTPPLSTRQSFSSSSSTLLKQQQRVPLRVRPSSSSSSSSKNDMAYTKENILRQAHVYQMIRKTGDQDCCRDVYVRTNSSISSNNQQQQPVFTYWFIGKIAYCTGTCSLNQAVARQLSLLEEHATRLLRPSSRSFESLQVWTAPVDSEVQCSQNDPSIVLCPIERCVEGAEPDVPANQVGFDCQVVTNQGVGFHIIRREDGTVPPELML